MEYEKLPDIVWAWINVSPRMMAEALDRGAVLQYVHEDDEDILAKVLENVREFTKATGMKPYVMRNTAEGVQDDEYYFWSEEYPTYDESARLAVILGYACYRIEEIKE